MNIYRLRNSKGQQIQWLVVLLNCIVPKELNKLTSTDRRRIYWLKKINTFRSTLFLLEWKN